MGKFPLLRFYRGLLWIAALVFLILGVLVVVLPLTNRGYSYYRPDFLSLLIASLPFLGASLGLGVFAEIITLFLHIENHLDEMKHTQMKSNNLLTSEQTQHSVSGTGTTGAPTPFN